MKERCVQNSAETEQSPVHIQFGTVFTVVGNPRRVDVVVDVGEDTWFMSAGSYNYKSRNYSFFHQGTSGRENINQILGHISLEEILAAANRGYTNKGLAFPPEVAQIYTEAAKKPPRILKGNSGKK